MALAEELACTVADPKLDPEISFFLITPRGE